MKPYARTATRRRDQVSKARKALSRWSAYMNVRTHNPEDRQTQAGRLSALLWAKAFIDRTLALETRGTLGDRDATPARILAAAGLSLEAVLGAPEGED